MPRVLVVDDEVGLRTALARGLMAEGMDVVTAADGLSALRAALAGTFDVILLDIIIPGPSGYRVLQRLRAAGVDTPVLLVSAKDGEVDQADGLDLGADGYVVKPFSLLVLLARVRALLRRQDDIRPGRVRLGELTMDPVAQQVRWAGSPVELSSREFSLLHALVRRSVLSRDELLKAAWGGEQAASTATAVA
jgi:DNA-binding response OmpR family regulator